MSRNNRGSKIPLCVNVSRENVIQMLPVTIPASDPEKVQHNIVMVPLQEVMTMKARKECITEEFVKGLFSPYVMHPTLKEAASIYGVPDSAKKFLTTNNWVFIGKEVAHNHPMTLCMLTFRSPCKIPLRWNHCYLLV